MPKRFTVIPDKLENPQDVRAAENAQKLLDAIPDDDYRAMLRTASQLATQGMVYGVPASTTQKKLALERLARDLLERRNDEGPH